MSKKIISLVLAGLISVSAYVHSYANESKNVEGVNFTIVQEKEPNNTINDAQLINFNETIIGQSKSLDKDFFKFKLNMDCTITYEATGYGNFYFEICDDRGKNIVRSSIDYRTEIKDVKLNSGTYYAKIDPWLYSKEGKYNFNIYRNYFKALENHWASSQINDFIDLGYVGGYSDGTFKPNNDITRAEFVKILNNAFGLTKFSGKLFSDTQNHWARKDIDIAVTNGVCNGKSATEFKPNDPITREEAAVMIANYKKIKDTNHDKVNIFYDNKDVSSWAKDGVEGVVEKGYMGGYNDNTFKPKGNITRAEAVATLSRVK